MKFKNTSFVNSKEILANDHYVAVPYDCSDLAALATDGVIPAGTIIPANDATAKGVLLSAVNIEENPNGTMVIHGFIKEEKLPAKPAESVDLKQISFI
ncbi:MAG: hypothetical protein NC110_06620 [Ruminococcus sp.]|nr:hypothetical protein [Ruminococcus sp.]